MGTKVWVLISLKWVGIVGAVVFVAFMLIWNPKTKKQWLIYLSLLGAWVLVWFMGRLFLSSYGR